MMMSQSSRALGRVAIRLLGGPAPYAEAQALTIACRMLDDLVAPQCQTASSAWTPSRLPADSSKRWMNTGMHVSGSDGRQLKATSADFNSERQDDMHASSFSSGEDADNQDEAGEGPESCEDPDFQELRQQLLQTALTFVVRWPLLMRSCLAELSVASGASQVHVRTDKCQCHAGREGLVCGGSASICRAAALVACSFRHGAQWGCRARRGLLLAPSMCFRSS